MNDDPAKARFLVIQALRVAGVIMVLIGIAILRRRIDLPDVAGYAIIAVGLLDALIVPTILARKWKTPLP